MEIKYALDRALRLGVMAVTFLLASEGHAIGESINNFGTNGNPGNNGAAGANGSGATGDPGTAGTAAASATRRPDSPPTRATRRPPSGFGGAGGCRWRGRHWRPQRGHNGGDGGNGAAGRRRRKRHGDGDDRGKFLTPRARASMPPRARAERVGRPGRGAHRLGCEWSAGRRGQRRERRHGDGHRHCDEFGHRQRRCAGQHHGRQRRKWHRQFFVPGHVRRHGGGATSAP